jgi:hypothetical protein
MSFKTFEELRVKYVHARLAELDQKDLRNAAIQRIRMLKTATVCARCNLHFIPPVDFCTSCGANIAHRQLSEEMIYEIAGPEFPNLIQSLADYTELAQERRERGLLGKRLLRFVVPPNARDVAEWAQTAGNVANAEQTMRGIGKGSRLGGKPTLWALAIAAVLFFVVFIGSIIVSVQRPDSTKNANQSTPQLNSESKKAQAINAASRLAPEGTVYNVVRLSVRLKHGITGIEPGTQLKVKSKNADGTLHVHAGDLVTDVRVTDVTNDLDVVDAIRKANQDAVQ